MDLRAIELFIAVAEYGSYTKAAEKMFVTQPYVSKVVKQLEDELNVTLLNRTTRRLELTDAGRVFLDQGKQSLKPLKDLPVLLDELQHVQKGEIVLGIPPVIGMLIFATMAQQFHSHFPEVNLRLVEKGAKDILSLVEEEQIDIGFTVVPFAETNVNVKPHFNDLFMIFLSTSHPLAHRKKINLSELKDEKFILFNNTFTLHDAVFRICQDHGFRPRVAYESSQWDLMIELIAINMGISILPRAIYAKQHNPNVKMVEIDVDTPYLWEIAMITKKIDIYRMLHEHLSTCFRRHLWNYDN
ncbi:LysR family transcriptional regulator [Kurthia senegalensis]|uniref:LysR family transcriptional regulator n=1 Tax=Kurthia senegalensis TaxID=1033740 RepID=UPI000288C772|nr:LysR family transcriptional regulator [Kurthia senegalensis]